MRIPFYRLESGREEGSNVNDVLEHDEINQVKELEKEFAAYIGVEEALATSHGTSALHLAMLALDLKRGDKVVCSVNAHPNVPEVVRHFDAETVFIDIDPEHYNMNLDLLENYLEDNQSKKLKAVILTHIAGNTVDLDRVYSMATIYDVKIVENACDSFGATYKGKKIGSTGADITCFDFSAHLKKSICNGGMIISNDDEMMKRARLLLNHGIVKEDDALEYIYDIVDIGNDYSLSQLNAGFIRAQLKKQDKNIKRQREIAKMYNEELDGVEHITLPANVSDETPFSLYIIQVDKNRDSFALSLREAAIQTGLYYIPLHLLAYYKTKYSLRVNDFPIALKAYQKFLALPIYASMDDKQVKYVIDTIKKIAKTRV